MKRGKRFGFSVYDSLACKQCKPNKFFHKRFGLTLHNKCAHGRDSAFKLTSVPSRSFTVGVQRRSLGSASKRTSAAAVRGRAAAMIELIELEDEDNTEEVEETQIVDSIGSIEDKKVVIESIEPMVMNDNESDATHSTSILLVT